MASYMMGDEMMGGYWDPKTQTMVITPGSRLNDNLMRLKEKALLQAPVTRKISFMQSTMMNLRDKALAQKPVTKSGPSWITGMKDRFSSLVESAKAQEAATQQRVIEQAQVSTPEAPVISPTPEPEPTSESGPSTETKKSSFLIPALIGIGVIAATMGGL